jgi:hypothetical protein
MSRKISFLYKTIFIDKYKIQLDWTLHNGPELAGKIEIERD